MGSIGVIGGGFFLTQAFSNKKEVELVTNDSNYPDIRHHIWSNQTQVKHFPAVVPSFARDVQVIYYPGSPEYGRIFQLRMKLPENQIKKAL
ncbi:MAG: hypothetical protein HC787_07325, partial [Nostocaceae cyanobacterium CSU_2_110]|nr:hypothetical protein [Nostocaceae cyanobacterium CSU_2_110]